MRIEKFSKLWIVKLLSLCRNSNKIHPTSPEGDTTGAKNQRKWFMKYNGIEIHVKYIK